MSAGNTSLPIGLLGAGSLYETLKQYLAEGYDFYELRPETFSSQISSCRLVIVCHDRWSDAFHAEVQALGQMHEVAWVPIYSEFDAVFLGPYTQSDTPGCFACAEHRRLCAIADRELFLSLREALEQDHHKLSQPWFTSWGLQILCSFIAAEVEALLQRTAEARTIRAVLQLRLSTLRWIRHRFLPNPSCSFCGRLPLDSAEAAWVALQPQQKLRPDTFRTRSLGKTAEQILETYVDREFGLVHHIGKRSLTACAVTTATARVEYLSERKEFSGIGRTLIYQQSHLAAIAEALERYSGLIPQSKRTVVYASFHELGEQALDPTTLGLHTPEQYAQPDCWHTPYQPDRQYNWVWGYSFGQQRPLLVPELYAYYGYQRKPSFVYEISNGCALGSCLEEAILYALLEVLERDAFLLTWYARLGVPRLDRSTIPSQRVRWMIERLEYTSGYMLSIFNTTLLHGAPCCWVVAVDEAQRADFPRMACTAGSHVMPEAAILSALLELAPTLQREQLQGQFQLNQQRAREMVDDSALVKQMEDHATLYMMPEAFARLNFLTQTPRQQTFQEAFAHLSPPVRSLDLTEDLTRLIDHYRAQGTDTIIVDQTTPEQRAQGFYCVKVIMPGMLPMTFGQQYRRVHGFKRLAEWPVLTGYRTAPLADTEINPYPHPFP